MGMEIHGPNMGRYDAGYLTAVQREMARSVRPVTLKEIDELDAETQKALLLATTDTVKLSPEAKAYLKKLREKLKKDKDKDKFANPDEADFDSLLAGLDDMRSQSSEIEEKDKKPLFPPTIKLSDYSPQAAAAERPKRKTYSPTRETLDKMIYHAPNKALREAFQAELEPLGFEIVTQVRNFGTKAIILPRNMTLTQLRVNNMAIVVPGEKTFDGRPWDVVRGLYDNSRRLLVIGEEQLGRPDHSVAIHEFAHAFDHAFSEKHGRRLPLSVQLWNLFADKRTGLVSGYASTNPAEYFAESVEAFFSPSGREHLEKHDKKMFDYLTELFQNA
ncbi:MAG: zinc-dependent peptidase [bacterium]|nr:zinc-dependent peptidase [bacterium]